MKSSNAAMYARTTPMRQGYAQHPTDPVLRGTAPRSPNRTQWARDGKNGQVKQQEYDSYAALATFLDEYPIPAAFPIDRRSIKLISHYCIYWHMAADPRTVLPPAEWDAQLLGAWLASIFEYDEGIVGWDVTQGRPTFSKRDRQATPSMWVGVFGCDPFDEDHLSPSKARQTCCRRGQPVILSLEIKSESSPILPNYRLKCSKNHDVAKVDSVAFRSNNIAGDSATLLRRWDRQEKVRALAHNHDLLQFYARMKLWYDTLAEDDRAADMAATPSQVPPGANDMRRVLYEPQIVTPDLINFSDLVAGALNNTLPENQRLGVAAQLQVTVANLTAEVATLNLAVQDRDQIIAGLQEGQVGERDDPREMVALRARVAALESGEEDLKARLAEKDVEIAEKDAEIAEKDTKIADLESGVGYYLATSKLEEMEEELRRFRDKVSNLKHENLRLTQRSSQARAP